MRSKIIKIFYNTKQVLEKKASANFSKSPLKPKLLLEYLVNKDLIKNFTIVNQFNPFNKNDFELAHNKRYVNEFFTGYGKCNSNGLTWSKQFAESVKYTNASLYEAIKNSIKNPHEISFSPTSGFHHATPTSGRGFCTFSGQVIASIKIYRKFKLSGAYLDLDGHFGNSIEDSREFCKDLNKAVPINFNINPTGTNDEYVENLEKWLTKTKHAILNNKIHYVVWCHGADSHMDDDLGNQCDTKHWTECSTIFWKWVKEMDTLLGRPLPVSCALFGGYRTDDYTSVLSLHTVDLVNCLTELLNVDVTYEPEITPRIRESYKYTYSPYQALVRYEPIKKVRSEYQPRVWKKKESYELFY